MHDPHADARTSSSAVAPPYARTPGYDAARDLLRQNAASLDGPLFHTDAGPAAWSAYLMAFPADERGSHVCHACRSFVDRYGGLATIDERGVLQSALFSDEPELEEYRASFASVRALVEKARVTGAFLTSDQDWGRPSNLDAKRGCEWHHLSVRVSTKILFAPTPLASASQRAAAVDQDFSTLRRAIAEFPHEVVVQALSIAGSEKIARGEKIVDRLQWLAGLHLHLQGVGKNGRLAENLVWRAAATAPAGWCHVRSSVIAPLLEDLASGRPFEDVRRAHDARMNPLAYLRPVAPPSAGQVAAAEEAFEKLGLTPALRRRFARHGDVAPHATWLPPAARAAKTPAGTFAHLLPSERGTTPVRVGGAGPALTWEKFARLHLADAEMLEVLATRGAYTALVTAADPDAPPIIQWDRPEARNAASWYTYHQASQPEQWGLTAGSWIPVTAVAPMPNEWLGGSFAHQGRGVILLLRGCRDSRGETAGVGLFPELLRGDLHAVRATIEAHSRGAKLEGLAESSASGVTMRAGAHAPIRIRATSSGTITEYVIDRWD